MKVSFERTGGLAGMRVSGIIDASTLPPDQARELGRRVEEASFFDLPATLPSSRPGEADRFHYRVTVETPEHRHTVEVDESAAPESLRLLLEWLTAASRHRAR